MDRFVRIENLTIEDNRISARFSSDVETARFFKNPSDEVYFEYSFDISRTPEDVAVIPFVANILPIVWLTDLNLQINKLDKKFFECITKVKEGFQEMYPGLEFKGNLQVLDLVSHDDIEIQNKSACLFSGGVDAFATLIAHASEKPDLITVWGADVRLYNEDAWEKIKTQNEETAELFGVNLITIKSNFTESFNYAQLDELVRSVNENWWHGIQHGFSFISMTAPIAWDKGIDTLYIASSHTAGDPATCASDPKIDNHVRFIQCKTIHDQYEYNRVEKTQHIADYVHSHDLNIVLRVCFRSESAENCCKCEKCIRTAAILSVIGQDITRFGFPKGNQMFRQSYYKVSSTISETAVPIWDDIKGYLAKHPYSRIPKNLKWIEKTDLAKTRLSFPVRIYGWLNRKIAKLKH